MAKIAFSKLDLKVNNTINQVDFINSKGESISFEVKEYLPIEDKLTLISNIINQSVDDNGYYNPMRVKIFTALEIVYFYTNLNFTAKQKENPLKLYDQLISTSIFKDIKNCISKEDLEEIENAVLDTIANIYEYKNSIVGILDAIKMDYSNLSLDAIDIQQKLADPENMELLKNVLTKLG